MHTIDTLSAELNLVNADRFALQCQVAELEEENARLSAELYAVKEWSVATAAMQSARVQMHLLGAALYVKDTVTETDFLAFPKFLAGQAATAAKGLWAKVPSIRVEAVRRTSRLGPSVG